MSYEVIGENVQPCPCGKGIVRTIIKENDFFQTKEDVEIECDECRFAHQKKHGSGLRNK